MTRVPFPSFELIGPPCQAPACKGVLVDNLSMKTKEFFRRCATCGAVFDRKPAAQKLAEAVAVIDRCLSGEDELAQSEPEPEPLKH